MLTLLITKSHQAKGGARWIALIWSARVKMSPQKHDSVGGEETIDLAVAKKSKGRGVLYNTGILFEWLESHLNA